MTYEMRVQMVGYANYRPMYPTTGVDLAGRARKTAEREEKARDCPFSQRRKRTGGKKLGDNESGTVLKRCNEDLVPASQR